VSPEPAHEARRVLIVSAYAHPHLGGVEVVVQQQARSLVLLGYQVRVVTSRFPGSPATEKTPDGYEVVRLAAWNGLDTRKGVPLPVWSPRSLSTIARLTRDADIVHVHDVYHLSSLAAAVAAGRLGKPLFVTQHVAIVSHDKAVVESAQRLCYASIAPYLWRSARRITAYNPIVRDFLTGHGVPAAKIELTCNGIDTTEFKPAEDDTRPVRLKFGLDPDLPVVLFVGRLVPKKGVHHLVQAGSPDYQIVLAGPGQVPGAPPAGVKFLGPVSRADLAALYQASDIFAFPATGEMLTLAMQEAMACGLPVVTTRDDAYDSYDLDPAGVEFVVPSPEGLRSAFSAILADDARRSFMRTYSRKLAEERFDWQKNAADLAAEYDKALAGQVGVTG
jgi:D-inositol-3-phosphate glycosyltransferase